MTTRTGRAGSRFATNAMARPSRSATSGVMGGSLATPRIPSVPKSLRSRGSGWADAFFLFTEVHELQRDAEVLGADRLGAGLQIVLVFAGHAHLRCVSRSLHL